MRRRMFRTLCTAATILGCGALMAAAPPAAGELVATGTLSDVVRAPGSGSVRLEVITGCGFSLRVLKCVTTSSTTCVTAKGENVRPGDLRPGSILKVRYRQEKEGSVALALEVLPPEGES